MRRSRLGQVEIFNFSFLDILACTIGLLIFIMVMVFVLQSGSTVMADYSKIIAKTDARADRLQKQGKADEEIARRLESETDRMSTLVDKDLVVRRTASKTGRDSAVDDFDRNRKILADLEASLGEKLQSQADLRKKLSQADAALADAQRRHADAVQREASLDDQANSSNIQLRPSKESPNSDVLFVDCQKDRVVMMKIPIKGKSQLLGATKVADLDAAGSNYKTQLDQHTRAVNPSVVFWIRPDGIATFEKAKDLLPAGLDYGYEPAAANWSFGVEH